MRKEEFLKEQISHWKYWPFFPITDLSKAISLGEGNTPLIQSKKFENFLLKFEGMNPTGSFKDRGSAIEISKAFELGVKKVLCASTGNMGASIAAYSNRANIQATVFVPSFAEKNKLKQMNYYGAKVKRINGSYETALNETRKLNKKNKVYLTGDYAFRGEGQKSIGFEILEQLHFEIPDFIVLPIGNGTLIWAVFKACREFKETGLIKKIPKLVGVQAQNCEPIVRAIENNDKIVPIKNPKTIATAICCGNPVDGEEAVFAIKESNGIAISVSEKEIMLAKKELGREGIYAENGGSVAFAGAKKMNLNEKGKSVIIVSGHGLKD